MIRRPERVALVLAVLAVAGGAVAAGVRVADGVADREVEFRGELSAREILANYHPGRGIRAAASQEPGAAHLSEAEGVATVREASGGQLAAWSLLRLAPWLLAAAVLALFVPILRAAERGDPFGARSAGRLGLVGGVLLVGIPLLAALEYLFASSANSHGIAPAVEPSLTVGVLHFLPGALLLALAGIFRAGGELRDLERHTV